jgi:hypothetical protein
MINRNILQIILGSILTLNWHVSLGHFLYSRNAAYKFVDKENLSADLHGSALKKSDCKTAIASSLHIPSHRFHC